MFLGNNIHDQITGDYVFSATRSYVLASSVIPTGNIIITNYDSVYDPLNNFNSGIYTVDKHTVLFLQFWTSSSSTYIWDFYLRKNSTTRISEVATVDGSWGNSSCFAIVELDPNETIEVYHGYHENVNNYLRYMFTGQTI